MNRAEPVMFIRNVMSWYGTQIGMMKTQKVINCEIFVPIS
jgi:hypothetical protein